MEFFGGTPLCHRRRRQVWVGGRRLMLSPGRGALDRLQDLEFDKYKGSSCPHVHLAMYCRKMAAYTYDDKVLIHCFHYSLIRAALGWYVGLEQGRIKTWRDLAEAFLKQEYAERWRELAAQVQPPIIEREIVTIFIDTIPSSYYDRVVGNVASNFANLVVVGKRIEVGIKRGKFA
ncbi:hypothetical protein CR513_24688, partial [Mucuna pruriens]